MRKLGGNVYLGITPTVKYVLAGNDFDSHKVKGAIRQGKRDILSVEWIIRSSETKTILPPRPQDYVFRAPRVSVRVTCKECMYVALNSLETIVDHDLCM